MTTVRAPMKASAQPPPKANPPPPPKRAPAPAPEPRKTAAKQPAPPPPAPQPPPAAPRLPDDTIKVERRNAAATPPPKAGEDGRRQAASLPLYGDAFKERKQLRANDMFPAPKGHMASHVKGSDPAAPPPSQGEVVAHMRKRYDAAARDLAPADRFALADEYSRRLVNSSVGPERDFGERLRIDEANHFRRQAEDAPNATKTLIDNFDSFVGASGHHQPGLVRREDLDAVRRGDHRPELKSAASFILDSPGMFDGLDDAAGLTKKNDGWIAKVDAQAYAAKLPPPADVEKKEEMRRYARDLISRPGAKEELDLVRDVARNPSHRGGKMALQVTDELRPADHASYDLRTNVRHGDENYFLTDKEVGNLFNADRTVERFAVMDLKAAGKYLKVDDHDGWAAIGDGRLRFKGDADKVYDPKSRLFEPDDKLGRLFDPFGKRRELDMLLKPEPTFVDPKSGKAVDMRFQRKGEPIDPEKAVPWAPHLPDPSFKAQWGTILNAYPDSRPYLMMRTENAEAVVDRYLTTTDQRFNKPRGDWTPETKQQFKEESERLLAEDRRRREIESGNPLARMRGDPASWTADQKRIADAHASAWDFRKLESKIRPEWNQLDAEYRRNKWGPDSPYSGPLLSVDLASKDPQKISRYDAWRGLNTLAEYRKKSPEVFADAPNAFKTRNADHQFYYKGLEDIRAANLPDYAERAAALENDPNNPFLYLKRPITALTDPERDRFQLDYSRYGAERLERTLRGRAVAGLGADVDKLVPHYGRMLEERGLVAKGVDYLRTHVGDDGNLILDSKISTDAIGKNVDEVIRAKNDLMKLRDFDGSPEQFQKSYQERLQGLQGKLRDTRQRMEEMRSANNAWTEGIGDVVATMAGITAAAAAPFTFGGSLIVGATAGALAKVAFKGLDSLESTAPYTSWRTDLLTGGLAGGAGAGSSIAATRVSKILYDRAAAGLAAGETLPITTKMAAFIGPRMGFGAADGFVTGAGGAYLMGEEHPLERGLMGAGLGMAMFPLGDGLVAGAKGLRRSLFGKAEVPPKAPAAPIAREAEPRASGLADTVEDIPIPPKGPIDAKPAPYKELPNANTKATGESLTARVEGYNEVHDPHFTTGMGKAIDDATAKLERLRAAQGGKVTPAQVDEILNEIGVARRNLQLEKVDREAAAAAATGEPWSADKIAQKLDHAEMYGRPLPPLSAGGFGEMVDNIRPDMRHMAYVERARAQANVHEYVRYDNKLTIDVNGVPTQVPLSNVMRNPWNPDGFKVIHPNFDQSRLLSDRAKKLYAEVLSDTTLTEAQAFKKLAEANYLMMHGTPFQLGSPASVEALNDAVMRARFGKMFPNKKPDVEPFWEAMFAPPGQPGLDRFVAAYRGFFE